MSLVIKCVIGGILVTNFNWYGGSKSGFRQKASHAETDYLTAKNDYLHQPDSGKINSGRVDQTCVN
jgi:hypothetical protein